MRSLLKTFASILIYAGKGWIGLIATGFVVLTGIAVYRFIVGAPGGEGIVMFPVVLAFSLMVCLPGAAVLALGLVLRRGMRNTN
ncbi:MAG TPA: hypothetical protein VLW75_04205 [Rhizomicrobium sp.]|nr:hypothetical protein [Rhizomicrobium sp.]